MQSKCSRYHRVSMMCSKSALPLTILAMKLKTDWIRLSFHIDIPAKILYSRQLWQYNGVV